MREKICRRCKCILRNSNQDRRLCDPCSEAKAGAVMIVPPGAAHLSRDVLTTEIVDKFWELAQRRGANRCWGWKGTITARGYATFQVRKCIYVARRVAYQLVKGAHPTSLLYNRCQNDACVNPAHVVEGRKQRR